MANCRNCCSGCGGSSGNSNCRCRQHSSCSCGNNYARTGGCYGNGYSQSGNYYGALNRIAGPYTRNLSETGYDPYENYPFYTGPCGPCEPCQRCCCKDLPWPWPPIWDGCMPPPFPSACNGAGFFANAPINVTAGSAIPLTAQAGNSACFASAQSGVQFGQPGLYMAVLTAQVGATETVNGQFDLTLNGQSIPGSNLVVNVTAPGTPTTLTSRALFRAQAGDVLLLRSIDALNLATAATAPFTVNLVRIA